VCDVAKICPSCGTLTGDAGWLWESACLSSRGVLWPDCGNRGSRCRGRGAAIAASKPSLNAFDPCGRGWRAVWEGGVTVGSVGLAALVRRPGVGACRERTCFVGGVGGGVGVRADRAGDPGTVFCAPRVGGSSLYGGAASGRQFMPLWSVASIDRTRLIGRSTGCRLDRESCGAELLDTRSVSMPASVTDCRACAGPAGPRPETGFPLGLVCADSVFTELRPARNCNADLILGKVVFLPDFGTLGDSWSATHASFALDLLSTRSIGLRCRQTLRCSPAEKTYATSDAATLRPPSTLLPRSPPPTHHTTTSLSLSL
jgi:hypothetical protein